MSLMRMLSLLLLMGGSTFLFGQDTAFISNKAKVSDKNKDIESVFGIVDIGNLKAINSEDLDYCATLVGDGVIFTSTRSHRQMANEKKKKNWKKKLSTLFYARLDSDGLYFGCGLEPQ